MPFYRHIKVVTFAAGVLFSTSAEATIVGDWNEAALAEVRASKLGPPMVARALAIAHTCMYDAWAQYDEHAVATTVLRDSLRQPAGERTDPNKAKAISFAAYRCLMNLFPAGASASHLEQVMSAHGYSLTDTTTPANIGNTAAQAVIDARANDGSNQYGNEQCQSGKVCPSNPVTVLTPVPCVSQTYPWTTVPLMQLGDAPSELQPLPCVGPGGAQKGAYADYDNAAAHYSHYVPSNPLMGYCDPLTTVCPAPDDFIDPSLTSLWPDVVDPDHWQPLVYIITNPHARQTFVGAHWENVTPFALTSAKQFDNIVPKPDVIKNAAHYEQNVDEILQYSADLDAGRKLIVEYWADGPDSELPPGHWGLFAQDVSRRKQHSIDEDVKMFFAMHNASFDAGIIAWHFKRKYDGVRPITAIRYLKQGQMVRAWGGPGQPTTYIPGEKWMPYNPGNNLTPPFPGYFSGHSTFSSASATVLQLFTGDDYFGFSTVIPANFGRVEPGIPAVPTTVSFATFSEAAQQAGLSRLYGGIHFSDDNTVGQTVGALIGQQAWDKAQTYFNGTAR
jgi:hypothetical protein